ncbi:MAG: SDR family NAD(P)-dependent oxidoreductase [Myxococcota bacterium]
MGEWRVAGRTCLVTGASSGIGQEVARALAERGAHVVMGCRSGARGEAARARITASTGNPHVEVMEVDTASQASLRRFARAFTGQHHELAVLINNAGMWSTTRQLSPEGIELTWATNVLGYFLLTNLLLPTLRASAPARIINVASKLARDLELSDVQFTRRHYSGMTAYAQSKQANRMWTYALERRLAGSGVTTYVVHPGGVNTGIFRKGGGLSGLGAGLYMRLFGKTVQQGADTVVYLATDPRVSSRSGRYWAYRQETPCRFRNEQEEERLWSLCKEMTSGSGA